MTYVTIDRHRQRVQAVIARARALDPGDPVRADLARHVCVLNSGYVEQTVKQLVLVHAANRGAANTVERFIQKSLKRFQNAKPDRIYKIVNSLDPALEEQVRNVITASQEAAIGSVVSLRHQIAHGGNATTSIDQQEMYFREIEQAMLSLRALLA